MITDSVDILIIIKIRKGAYDVFDVNTSYRKK